MSGPCLSSRVAVQPLSPATRHCLGGPLPRQLADRPWTAPPATCVFKQQAMPLAAIILGISPPFGGLSPTGGYVIHVLHTLPPLYSPSCPGFLARLACIRHTTNVRSEPGSNSSINFLDRREIW